MVSVEDAVIARVTRDHNHFEILVDPEKALRFKKGEDISIDSILAVRDVFKDARKGERVPEDDLEKVFQTTDINKIAAQIMKEGDIQLTTEQRRRFIEEKRKQIANIISKQGVNPQTKLPHPVQRILNAMDEAKIAIDPFKPAEEQVKNVVSDLQSILPISIERIEIALRVPIQYAGKASSVVRNLAPVKKEEWKSDAWIAVIEIPAGMQANIYSKLNELTSGQVEVKVVKKE
ncbi:MAG: ribosome assembly factor SBDS [Candidatus Aenigmatarchaeota archaeon]|nr:MAG: ribosome assembly factor SBDS [Candidatus Aenigmarchaeota archaeon]